MVCVHVWTLLMKSVCSAGAVGVWYGMSHVGMSVAVLWLPPSLTWPDHHLFRLYKIAVWLCDTSSHKWLHLAISAFDQSCVHLINLVRVEWVQRRPAYWPTLFLEWSEGFSATYVAQEWKVGRGSWRFSTSLQTGVLPCLCFGQMLWPSSGPM